MNKLRASPSAEPTAADTMTAAKSTRPVVARKPKAANAAGLGSKRGSAATAEVSSTRRAARVGRRQDDVMFALMHASAAIEKRLEESLGRVGLSLAKFGALSHLVAAGEPMRLSDCAARMTCVRSNITQLVDRLEADGLARRMDDPADRRSVLAAATPLGIERQAAGEKLVAEVQKRFARSLSRADRLALARVLVAVK